MLGKADATDGAAGTSDCQCCLNRLRVPDALEYRVGAETVG